MLPATLGKAARSNDGPGCGPAPPGDAKDILMIYEEDANEWALYLREIFLCVVKKEAILLYCLENFSPWHLKLLSLSSYKCKLLILSNGLLQDLTPKKCQFLEEILCSPESIVTLLCGTKSSDQLYQLLNVSGSRWEISTEQQPEDYIFVIKQVIFGGSEDYLEVEIPTDPGMKHAAKPWAMRQVEDLPGASRSSTPLAMVLPAEIPCENPGEIFILLRDEVICETVEVEFMSNNKHIRKRPTLWNKNVWCMKALDFPAGSVHVNVYCDGIIKATAEIKYYTAAKATQCPVREAHLGEGLCQNDIEELDGILTSIFKHEISYYEFQSHQTEIYSQKEYTHVKQLPTLLHCAARFGLKNLATHLLQCSGATWASKMKNTDGSDPAHLAKMHGHKQLIKIFEDFSIQEIIRNKEQENDSEEDIFSFSSCSPSTPHPALHHESEKTHRQSAGSAGGAEAAERAWERMDEETRTEAQLGTSEACGSGSPEDPYDDLYVSIPGIDPENNPQEPLTCCRPPLPPPRIVPAAFQLEKPHFVLQTGKMVEGQVERSQSWNNTKAGKETREELKIEEKKEDGKREEEKEEEEEDPYTFTEIDDNEYDLILASKSIKKKTRSRSFIINRPPAPTPRPTHVPPKEETTPYIAQVFQQKAARRQSDGDKFHGPPKKPDKARVENPAFPTARGYLATGQEELILLQEKVKNGKMSVDEALEKFKHWQMGQSGLEMIQQEKLRQLRDSIIGKRPEEENFYDKLTIVHHPSGNIAHNENMLNNNPLSNKLPARLQLEKEFGFCYRKDH